MKANRTIAAGAGRCARLTLGIGASALLLTACGLFLSDAALLKRAREEQKRGELRAAAIDLKKLLEKSPDNGEARFTLGLVDLASGDVTTAVRDFERARTNGIATERLVDPLVRAYQAQREFDKALQLLDSETAKASSADAKAGVRLRLLRLRGEVLFAKRDIAGARTAFESALAESPHDVSTLLGLAGVVAAVEGLGAALTTTERALAAAPDDVSVHLMRGALFLQMRKPGDGAAEFQKASELAVAPDRKTDLLTALSGLAQAQLAQGQVEPALKITERIQELAPKAASTRFVRAYALAQSGELDQARTLLEQNVAQGEDLRSRLLLGAVNLSQGRYSQAEMQLSTVVAAAPNNAEARQLLAESRLRQSKPADALDTLLPALENGANTSASMLALAGQASLAAGKTKEGVALLKRNAEQNPKDTRVQLDLAAGYLAAGQADQALVVLGESPAKANAEKAPGTAEESEAELVRREYLTVLARMQKNDATGATAHAVKIAQDRPQSAALQTLAASALLTQRQYDKARPFAEAAVRLQPNAAAGYANLGRLDALQGNVDAARKDFRNALAKQPDDGLSATALAFLEMSGHHNDEALAVLGELRKHNAKSVEPRTVEIQLLLATGKVEEAEKLARATVELANDNASVLAALGRVLSTQGRHGEALTTFERAVHVQPNSAPLRFQLAVAQRMAGRNDDALATAREALKIDEHFAPALQLDGLLSIAKGDLTTASRRADDLLKTAPDLAVTHELAGALRFAQKRFSDAVVEYQKAGELNPRPQFAIAEFEARTQGRLPDAEVPLTQFLAANPSEPTVRIVLAQALQRRGDRAGAAKAYELVLTNQPKNVVALNNLAWIHYEDGKPDATDLARRAYNTAPSVAAIADTYAWILVNSGKVAEGLKLFETLFNPTKQSAARVTALDIRAHYAVTLSRAGRQSEAKALAKDVTAANTDELSADLRTLLAELIKS